LRQVQNSASSKLPCSKAVLVLGNNEAGKTSLIAKMQGNADPRKGSGLEYQHMLVRDEYRDEHTKLGFWIVDGSDDVVSKNLLTFALNEETFSDTTVLLTASMTAPWDLLSALQKWSAVLEQHIASLKIPAEDVRAARTQCAKRFLDYISPGDEIEGLVSTHSKSRSDSLAQSPGRDLPDGVLTHNLGLDVVVVITKTDYMSVLEKQQDFKEETFDFIQQAVRKFCLQFGASLFYVSAKINKNCDLLYKYLGQYPELVSTTITLTRVSPSHSPPDIRITF
jgi:dynein light intermediate chain 1